VIILVLRKIRVTQLPIYEYKCNECDQVFDVLQKIGSDPVKDCIHCGGKVKKLISASSFQFKGSGWYVTDYKKNRSDENKKERLAPVAKKDTATKPEKGKEKQKNVA